MNKQLIVVKVGTSSLTGADGSMSPEKVGNIVRQIADLRDAGTALCLVTSGSIAAGFRRLGYGSRRHRSRQSRHAPPQVRDF